MTKVDNVNDAVLAEAPKAGGKPMWLRRYDVGANLAADRKNVDLDVKLDLVVRRSEFVRSGESPTFAWQLFSFDSKLTVVVRQWPVVCRCGDIVRIVGHYGE